MAEQASCPACGQRFGSRREADDHAQKMHGDAAKKGGEAAPEKERPPSTRPHGD